MTGEQWSVVAVSVVVSFIAGCVLAWWLKL